MDEDVVLEDAGAEVHRVARARPVVLVPRLVGRQRPQGRHGAGRARGHDEDAAEAVLDELVLHHGQGLEVVLHPDVIPRSVAGSVQRDLVKMLGDHVSLVAVLLGDPVQHQLGAHVLVGVLLFVLRVVCSVVAVGPRFLVIFLTHDETMYGLFNIYVTDNDQLGIDLKSWTVSKAGPI